MKKIIILMICFFINNTILTMNPDDILLDEYKNFLNNVDRFLLHIKNPEKHSQYIGTTHTLEIAKHNVTSLISHLDPLSDEENDHKKIIDDFLAIVFYTLFSFKKTEVFLGGLMIYVYNDLFPSRDI